MTSGSATHLNVAPVWWDRERRKISFGGRAFTPALMLFDRASLSVVTAERVVFEANARDIHQKWVGKYCCDATVNRDIFRLYFAPPNVAVKRLTKPEVEKIAGIVANVGRGSSILGHLLVNAAMIGDYAAILGFVGKSLSFYQTMSDVNAAKTNAARFRALCDKTL